MATIEGFKLNPAHFTAFNKSCMIALAETAEALHTEIVQAQVVPRDKGTLQNEGFFVDYSLINKGQAILTHTTPYARRLYFHPEYNFSKDKNPNAKGRWFEDWLKGGKYEDFAEKAFAELLKKELNK